LVNFEGFSQEFWSVGTKYNEAHSFVCHSTLISCAGFKLPFTIAEKLVYNATGVFALISLSLVWFALRNPEIALYELRKTVVRGF